MAQLKKYTLIIAALVMVLNSNAQEAKSNAFSLQQAIDYAMKNSPNYLNAQLDHQSADFKRKEIAGIGLPQVKGSFDVKNYIEIPTSLIPAAAFNPNAPADAFAAVKFGTKYNSTAGISASQLIFSSDYIFGLRAAKEFMNLSKINVNRNKAEVTAEVSKAYYSVLINHDRIKFLDANVLRLKKILDDTKAYNQQGIVELIDVERLEVQYNNLVTERSKIEKLIGLAENMLKFQMGYQLSDAISLSDSLNVANIEYQELGSSKINIAQRPDVQLMQAQQNLLDIDAKRLQWGYLPTLAAYGAYNFNRQGNKLDLFGSDASDPTKQWYKIALIGIALDVNIFDGLQRHNKIQQAKIAALKNSNTIKNISLGAELEATAASVGYNNAFADLMTQKKNIDLAQRVVNVAQKKYTAGVGSNMEVINAETALKEAQTNYYNAIFDLTVSKIDYQKATGTLVK